MKFSLLTLIGITSLAGLACAALAKPSGDWLTVVITLTALAFSFQLLRALVLNGGTQAAAIGWLMFAAAYLALVFSPWLGERTGPDLITSRVILAAQQRWLPEARSAGLQLAFSPDGSSLVASTGSPWQTAVKVNSDASYSLVYSLLAAGDWGTPAARPPSPAELFCRTAHWLCAWLAGGLGAAVAAFCYSRRRNGGSDQA